MRVTDSFKLLMGFGENNPVVTIQYENTPPTRISVPVVTQMSPDRYVSAVQIDKAALADMYKTFSMVLEKYPSLQDAVVALSGGYRVAKNFYFRADSYLIIFSVGGKILGSIVDATSVMCLNMKGKVTQEAFYEEITIDTFVLVLEYGIREA